MPCRKDQHSKHDDSGIDTFCDATTCGGKSGEPLEYGMPAGEKSAWATKMPLGTKPRVRHHLAVQIRMW